jgi:hypothetical protein
MAVYLPTLPGGPLLEDAGTFLMACRFCGVAHPPGYPLHTLLCRLFTLLPLGSVAFRGALLSASFGAASGVAVAYVTQALVANRLAAGIAGLAYVTSRVFWSQAVTPEVYTLNTFLFFTLLALATQFTATGRRSLMLCGGLLLGLSLSNHWPLIVISSPALALILWPRRGDALRALPAAAWMTLLGLTPYWRGRGVRRGAPRTVDSGETGGFDRHRRRRRAHRRAGRVLVPRERPEPVHVHR